MIFFTSDQHFGHEKVLEFDRRPFSSTEQMETEMIARWNRKVKQDDTVYILGDFIWKSDNAAELLRRLNGKKIILKGNHDKWLRKEENREGLEEIKDYDEIFVKLKDGTRRKCILCHYPIHFYNGHYRGSIMLYGHTHTTREEKLVRQYARWLNGLNCPVRMYNVGCMHWEYAPVTLDELLEEGQESAETYIKVLESYRDELFGWARESNCSGFDADMDLTRRRLDELLLCLQQNDMEKAVGYGDFLTELKEDVENRGEILEAIDGIMKMLSVL